MRFTGCILAYIRILQQAPVLKLDSNERIVRSTELFFSNQLKIPSFPLDLKSGRTSVLGSTALGAILAHSLLGELKAQDADMLQAAIDQALVLERTSTFRGHEMGVDEVLYGRTGLLWALLQMDEADGEGKVRWNEENLSTKKSILNILHVSIPKLCRTIIQAGLDGAADFVKQHGSEDSMPLMWSWIDSFYSLGLMHGITGILSVLLSTHLTRFEPKLLEEHGEEIAETITELCKISIKHNGQLPMSVPHWPSEETRVSPLVQICHGAPGLLMVLAFAGLNGPFARRFYKSFWVEALHIASRRVWEQGILSKGGGLCHGIAGNAWTLLVLHDAFDHGLIPVECIDACGEEVKRDLLKDGHLCGEWFLERAVAMLLECRNTRPFVDNDKYRWPDSPYSLFEGLAGTVCAWMEAALTVRAKMRKMELQNGGITSPTEDKEYWGILQAKLGFPGIGFSIDVEGC